MNDNVHILKERKTQEIFETEKLACYLISLFYKSNCKYFCSRPKINRLLTIYKLSAIRFHSDCFHYYFNIDGPYIGIGGFIPLIDRDVYLNFKTENGKIEFISNDNKKYFSDKFNEAVSIPQKYCVDKKEISKSKRDLLEIIFRKFASY